jgi:hypothetical protein
MKKPPKKPRHKSSHNDKHRKYVTELASAEPAVVDLPGTIPVHVALIANKDGSRAGFRFPKS